MCRINDLSSILSMPRIYRYEMMHHYHHHKKEEEEEANKQCQRMTSISTFSFHRRSPRASISGNGIPERCLALRVRGFATGTRLACSCSCGGTSCKGCKGCSWIGWRLGKSISRDLAGALRVLRFPRRLYLQIGQAPAFVSNHFSKHFKWKACGRQPDFRSDNGDAPQGKQRTSSSALISTMQIEHSVLSGSPSQSSRTEEPLAKNALRTLCSSWEDRGSTGNAAWMGGAPLAFTTVSARRWRINVAMAWRFLCSWYQAGSGSLGSLAQGFAWAARSTKATSSVPASWSGVSARSWPWPPATAARASISRRSTDTAPAELAACSAVVALRNPERKCFSKGTSCRSIAASAIQNIALWLAISLQ